MCNLCSRRWVISLDIFMHIICTSVWAEWEWLDWLIKCTQGDYTNISFSCYGGSAIAFVFGDTMHVCREEYFDVWADAPSSTHSCQPTTMALAYRRPELHITVIDDDVPCLLCLCTDYLRSSRAREVDVMVVVSLLWGVPSQHFTQRFKDVYRPWKALASSTLYIGTRRCKDVNALAKT